MAQKRLSLSIQTIKALNKRDLYSGVSFIASSFILKRKGVKG